MFDISILKSSARSLHHPHYTTSCLVSGVLELLCVSCDMTRQQRGSHTPRLLARRSPWQAGLVSFSTLVLMGGVSYIRETQMLLPQLSLAVCLALSLSGVTHSFQMFSMLNIWEASGTHRRAYCLASLNSSHIRLHRQLGVCVGELIKPAGHLTFAAKVVPCEPAALQDIQFLKSNYVVRVHVIFPITIC